VTAPAAGIPLDDPAEFAASARRAREAIGAATIDEAVADRGRGSAGTPPLGTFDVVQAFGRVDVWTLALERRVPPDDPIGMLRFAMICRIINRCASLQNAEHILLRMRDSLRGGDLDAFEAAFFEMETASYWLDQMGAVEVGFGPPSGHPDVWAAIMVGGGRLRLAIECKRVQPISSYLREFNTEAHTVEVAFDATVATHGPLKCIVWLHCPLEPPNSEHIAACVNGLASQLPADRPADEWITAGDHDGSYQVSVARLGAAAVFSSAGHSISDVPAEPTLFSRAESRRVSSTVVESRVKSLLGLRSDELPDRVGSLRANVSKAINQLSAHSPAEIGIVSVRIRRPSALGDLWEAERAVRGKLASQETDHVGLVVLFWDESETSLSPETAVDNAGGGVERRVAYSLRPYFVSNPACRLRFGHIDSRSTVFLDPPSAFVRDPVGGDLRPISPQDFDAVETGGDLPSDLAEAAARVGELPQEAGDATIYWRLAGPLGSHLDDVVMGVIRAGARQFRVFLDRTAHVRVIEITARAVRAVATIDVRAWLTQEELGLVLTWHPNGFVASLWFPDEQTRLKARSSEVRPVPP